MNENRTEQIKLFCGDSSKVLKFIPDESIDLTVTSPPYDDLRNYNGYSFDFKAIANELYRVTKKGGMIVWIVADATKNGSETGTSFKQALYFKKIGFNLHDTMIWKKDTFNFPCPIRYGNCFEYMFIFSKGKPNKVNKICDRINKYSGCVVHGTSRNAEGKTFRKSNHNKSVVGVYGERFNVWEIPSEKKNKTNHPAVFPVVLAKDHIRSWSNAGDTILDCFMGSGTTGIASVMLDRKFIGIEISEEYFETAKKRIEEAKKQFICYGCDFNCNQEDKRLCNDYMKWRKKNVGY